MKKALAFFIPMLVTLQLTTTALVAQQVTSVQKNTNNALPTGAEVISPTANQSRVDQLITEILTKHHYRKIALNDSMSSVIFDRYLKTLDFNRNYLLASDIQGFEKYRNQLDDCLKEGNLLPAYDMFNVFKTRFKERTGYVSQLLKKEPDFTINETYQVDREKASWIATEANMNEEWRKLIKNQALGLKLTGKSWEETSKVLGDRFKVQDKTISQYNSEDVFQLYMNAFTEAVDPHSSYFSPSTADNFKIDMSNSLEGIGAQLRVENDYTKVAETIPGGPAFKSKQLFKDDKITGVAQGADGKIVDVVGWRIDEVVKLIRGPKGTMVRLQILSASEGANAMPKEVRLVRDKIKLEEQSAKKEIIPITQNNKTYRLGVITVPSFYLNFEARQKGEKDYESTTRDVRRLITQLNAEKVDGLVIDLRNNGGGSLDEAIQLTGLFIPEGPVVQVRDMNGEVEVAKDPDSGVAYAGPLGVLINRFSASASEIFAAAIQDYKRGVIIGEQTYGKGTVQNLLDLNRYMSDDKNKLGQVKLTIAKFYRVTGSSTQHRGVTPDIELPSAYSAEEFGESSEPSALPWDQIASAQFKPAKNVTPQLVGNLVSRSQQRLKTEPELKNWVEDLTELKLLREKTIVSLKESERKKEVAEAEKKKAARAKMTGKINTSDTAGSSANDTKKKDAYLNEGMRIMADLLASVS